MKAYGLNKCTTCQKALCFLEERKVSFVFRDHHSQPPTARQVAGWCKALGGWEKLINRSGYTWRGLPEAAKVGLTLEKAAALAVQYPSLIRRPLIEHDDGTVTVGFSPKVQALFG
jgi:arsenate reductase (glutaredoxin)